MRTAPRLPVSPALLALLSLLVVPSAVRATDVDGGNDCPKPIVDWGDAPEDVLAYPGVLGRFPTCLAPGPVGTQDLACPAISTAPGAAGFVRHVRVLGRPPYWLGCTPTQGGLDHDAAAKFNATGGAVSACGTGVGVDCLESAFGMSFGQDECAGSDDSGLATALTFATCASVTLPFTVTSCATTSRDVFLNVLVDWNQDGDWNDNLQCPGGCAYEWAVKNVPIVVAPGCQTLQTPAFLTGPRDGYGWLRITVSDAPVGDDFPWAGAVDGVSDVLLDGETEDHPVVVGTPTSGPCPDYEDWGDAPEDAAAYSNGVLGHFPTCSANGTPGTLDVVCPPRGTPPGPTGAVRHVAGPADPKFWFGCGDPAAGTVGIDAEGDGKTNSTGAAASQCAPTVGIDCAEPAFTLAFGQDECIGDVAFDSGLRAPVAFAACSLATVDFWTFACPGQEQVQAFLNVLVDMNQDGDWNDNFQCVPGGPCAHEWAIKNQPIVLAPGCQSQQVKFPLGPQPGEGWMRMTLTLQPVGDDFPWAGSSTAAGPGAFVGGETEDHPVRIRGRDTCRVAFEDLGDAPEDLPAYASGTVGRFPTCVAASAPGTQELECGGPPLGTPPGATGHVRHVTLASDADHFWLGCGGGFPLSAFDGERDGKVAVGAPFGGPSACDPAVTTDCVESLVGLPMNQDECAGDLDAGVGAPVFFHACSTGTVTFGAYNCSDHDVTVHLNVLVDWNHDGDWNDAVKRMCTLEACAPEWSVKNAAVTLAPGCNTLTSPTFPTGPTTGRAWMRVSLSSDPAPDDFPWNGSASLPGGTLRGGESEDHAANVVPPTSGAAPAARPTALWLAAPRPNPGRDATRLTYGLPRAAEVSLAVYDLAGRRLAELDRGPRDAGVHTVGWDFRDERGAVVAPGSYLVKLRVGDELLSRRLVRLR